MEALQHNIKKGQSLGDKFIRTHKSAKVNYSAFFTRVIQPWRKKANKKLTFKSILQNGSSIALSTDY